MFLKFGVVSSIVCKHRTLNISAFELNGSRIKKFRKSERLDAGKALRTWIETQRNDNVSVRGSFSHYNFCSCRILILF